jgi:hypothetical protein
MKQTGDKSVQMGQMVYPGWQPVPGEQRGEVGVVAVANYWKALGKKLALYFSKSLVAIR